MAMTTTITTTSTIGASNVLLGCCGDGVEVVLVTTAMMMVMMAAASVSLEGITTTARRWSHRSSDRNRRRSSSTLNSSTLNSSTLRSSTLNSSSSKMTKKKLKSGRSNANGQQEEKPQQEQKLDHKEPQKQAPDDDDDSELLDLLHDAVPDSTLQERRRFLLDHRGNVHRASVALSSYLEWSFEHKRLEQEILVKEKENRRKDRRKDSARSLASVISPTGDDDWDDWNMATAVASYANSKVGGRGMQQTQEALPPSATSHHHHRVARMDHIDGIGDMCDIDGHRMIQITPAMLDDRIMDLKTHSLAIAIYVDKKLSRKSTDKLSILIDVRGGDGWSNPHCVQLMSFIRYTFMMMLPKFPLRLSRVIIYPAPVSCMWIWTVMRRCFDTETANKMVVLTGTATRDAIPPIRELTKYMDRRIVQHLEHKRLESFMKSGNDDQQQ